MTEEKLPNAETPPTIPPEQIEKLRQQAFADEIAKVCQKHGYQLVPIVVTVPMMGGTFVLQGQMNIVKLEK